MRALRWIFVTMLGAAACGHVGYDPVEGGDDGGAIDAAIDAAITVDARPPCPVPYVDMDGSCYLAVGAGKTWSDAEAGCEVDGAHLVTVVDVAEHHVVHALGASIGATEFWIGYSDRITEGTFRWVSPGGIDALTDECFFGTGGPINSAADNCVTSADQTMCGDWFVRSCDFVKAYICEHDGVAADPTAF